VLFDGGVWCVAIYGATRLATNVKDTPVGVLPTLALAAAAGTLALAIIFVARLSVRSWRHRHAANRDEERRDLPVLERKSMLMGMLTSGFVIANAAAATGTVTPSSIGTAMPPYTPKWTPSTPYALGQQVISPNNDVVSAKVAQTSSAAFATDSAKWTGSPTYARFRIYSPEEFGALGNGVADDTAAVRAAFAAANALVRPGLTGAIFHPGASVVLTGTYKLTSLAAPIDVLCNVMESRAALIVPSSYAGTALRVGHTTAGFWFQNAQINLPDVVKSTNALIISGSVGVRVMNIGNSTITFSRTCYFETGIHLTGLGQGTAYNQINIGWVSYCMVSLMLKPETGGWVNQNTFIGGGMQQSVAYAGGGLRRAGWRHLILDGNGINVVNMNTFVGTSFEGDVSEYVFEIREATNNTWLSCRHEPGTAGQSVAVSGSNLTTTAHGLAVSDMLTFKASTPPGGMFLSSPYFVVATPTADTFTVSQKKGGSAVTFTTAGTSVTHYRPARLLIDSKGGGCSQNVIRDPFTAVGALDILDPVGIGGTVVTTSSVQTSDSYEGADLPVYRARNRAGTASRPLFAAYPPAQNPAQNPRGWTAALSDRGVVFAASERETGIISSAEGALNYKRPADAVPYDIASCRRSPALIPITALACAANTTTTTTFSLTGAATNDHTLVTMLSHVAGIVVSHAYVSSANTVTVVFGNLTSGVINLTTSLQAVAFRRYF
jgi:hypothetical protein